MKTGYKIFQDASELLLPRLVDEQISMYELVEVIHESQRKRSALPLQLPNSCRCVFIKYKDK